MHVTATDDAETAAAVGVEAAAPQVGRTDTAGRLRPALLLGVFFASLYLLTMGGHLDSPDEELMFQVTRSLAERGSLDIGDAVSLEQLALPGVDGRAYTHYAPVSSLLSVPFYDLGRVAAALAPGRYREVIERFAVGLRDPLLSAGAGVLIYLAAVELGFEVATAVWLALAFGLATLVWPFAKYSWTEPVTGFWLLLGVVAAQRAVRSTSDGTSLSWSVVSSVALGLAIGSKITAALAVPALCVYLFAAGSGGWTARLKRSLPFAALMALPALGLALLNTLRFGSPLETGYYVQGYLWHPIGVAGLLVSPSKSLFLYAPIALLGLVGLGWLARRRPWDAGLCAWLMASHVLVYGLWVVWWHGDAAWGPRYLVPVLPFIVLPVGAVLDWTSGAARVLAQQAFRVLVGLGIVINLGGVLVDQRVSFDDLLRNADYNPLRMDDLRWVPGLSPVLIHWREFGDRATSALASWSQPVSLVSGTYAKEPVAPENAALAARSPVFPRWTAGDAVFTLRNHGRPTQLHVEYTDNRPASIGASVVQVVVNGEPLPAAAVHVSESKVALPDKRYPWVVDARLDDAVVGRDTSTVEIRSQPWQPKRDAPPSTDIRELGIFIWSVQFEADGHELPLDEAPISPMPVSDAQPWSYALETWFYTPPHLADVWLWYLYLSGLPQWLLLLGLLPAAGLAWSIRQLWRLLRAPVASAPAPVSVVAAVATSPPPVR